MPPKPRKSGDEEYIPSSDSEESESPDENTSSPRRGRPKEKSTESSSAHGATSKHNPRSKKGSNKSPSKTVSYTSSSVHSSRTSSNSRPNVGGTKVVRKGTRRFVRRQNTLVVKKVDNSAEVELLAKLPLPSSSIPHVYNKKISLIGSINIQALGVKKFSNRVIMRIIADILMKYDIVLCQEIHIPKSQEELMQEFAEMVSTPATPYSYIASEPIGRNSYQERYLFMYRKNEWKVLDSYVIDDDEKLGDKFIRDPYVVRFEHLRKSNVRITLVGCHTQPEKAFDEIKVLVTDVYVNVKKKLQRDIIQEKRQRNRDRSVQEKAKKESQGFFSRLLSTLRTNLCCCFYSKRKSSVSMRDSKEEIEELSPSTGEGCDEPIVMMGDFNAAGAYVNKKQRAELDKVLQKNKLMWGIQHSTDTTVADGPNSAYDRFVFEVANERRWIGNTSVWRFDESWEKHSEDKTLIKKAAKQDSNGFPQWDDMQHSLMDCAAHQNLSIMSDHNNPVHNGCTSTLAIEKILVTCESQLQDDDRQIKTRVV
ncbi:11475_t:CDS:2 [Acaulospora morrowiae]|uniref:11475_t:CDS:1 n=1 Tax=Acaulospora morrowiae TaxID=94023 RepID=A0A9N9B547_9GLOM|nr:11475_t:CDS:2 [Acaulospora morrowiae]